MRLFLHLPGCHINFNSIKVRLELVFSLACLAMGLFQFHKGTIRTIIVGAGLLAYFLNFNSIKVRLEPLRAIRV